MLGERMPSTVTDLPRPAAALSLDGSSGRLAWACVLALTGLAFWFRVGPARPVVLPDDGPGRLLGTDAYDHLRRAAQLSGTLPADLAPRPAHPDDWVQPGVFDAALALPAIVASGSPPRMEALIASGVWLPPILGALSILFLFALARSSLPPADAVLVALLYLVYPAESLDRTTLGFGDHHAAEVALTLLAAWAVTRLLRTSRERPWWQPAIGSALPMVALLHVWRGAALTLALLAVGMAGMALAEALSGGDAGRMARRATRYGLGVTAGMLLVRWTRPDWQLGATTMSRAWLVLAALLALAPILAIVAASARGRLGRLAPALWVLVLAAGGAAALATIPAVRLLAAAGPRTPLVQEHVAVDAGGFFGSLGTAAVLALPGLAVVLLAIRRRRLPTASLIPTALALGATALWWRTRDVGYLPPPFLAFLAGCALWACRTWWLGNAPALLGGAARRGAALSLVPGLVLALAPAWPCRLTDPPWTSHERAASLLVYDDAALEVATWLRHHTPAASSYLVAAPWVLGNLVAAIGERRPLWSRMPTAAAGSWLLARSEEESLAVLAAVAGGDPVRFALIDARSCGSYFVSEARSTGVEPELVHAGELRAADLALPRWELGPAYRESLAAHLCFGDGSDLRRYRLLWESPQRLVTVHHLALAPSAGEALQVRLVSLGREAARGLGDADAVRWSADGREVFYGAREHAAFRLFAIEGGG